MVLRVDQLSQFSHVLFDFLKESISFTHEGTRLELNEAIKEEFYMKVGTRRNGRFKQQKPIAAELRTMVNQFPMVFLEPKVLPPIRFNDQRVPLKDGAQTFKIRPYRCRYIQNGDFEMMVKNEII